jgi:hypothetical protein
MAGKSRSFAGKHPNRRTKQPLSGIILHLLWKHFGFALGRATKIALMGVTFSARPARI